MNTSKWNNFELRGMMGKNVPFYLFFLKATIQGPLTFTFSLNGLYEFMYVFIDDSPCNVNPLHL